MMKYKIGRNGGLLILFLMIAITNCAHFPKVIKNLQDFCLSNGDSNIGLDQNVELNLKSYPSSSHHVSKIIHKSKRGCHKKFNSLLTASHLVVTISNMKIPKCQGKCQCNYFEVSEMGNKTKYCGENNSTLYFESKTNSIYINFVHSMHMTFEVTIHFTVERNTYIRNGPPGEGQFIESPYFPLHYPRDYTAEYIIQNLDPDGHVVLLFLDFQMSQMSYIEISGHNGSHVDKFDGTTFRPPAIVSQGQKLMLTFEANDQVGSYPGFRAICIFERSFEAQESPDICGGLHETPGGVMTVSTLKRDNQFDCIWRVQRPALSAHRNDSILSVYISDFNSIGRRASLEFREGLYSKSPVKRSLNCDNSNCSLITGSEVQVAASLGLYIRFNGYLNAKSLVKMSFSIFHTGECGDNEFMCDNGRCIQRHLHCDDIDHCTDGSDEKLCSVTEVLTQVSTTLTWRMPLQPFGIQKEKLSGSSSAIFLVFLMFGVVGVAVVLIGVAVLLHRQYKKRNRLPEQAPTQHIAMTEIIGIPLSYPTPMTNWDVPPSYDDFLRTSDAYPPLLFTRVKQYPETSYLLPRVHGKVEHCQNTVELPETPLKENRSQTSHPRMSLPREASDCSEEPTPGCSSSDAMTWTFKGTIGFKTCLKQRHVSLDSKGTIGFKTFLKRPVSLDSNLNKVTSLQQHCINCCHLHLSITHADCSCTTQAENAQCCCRSLTSDFKLGEIGNVGISMEGSAAASSGVESITGSDANRRYTWSVVTDCSISDSEIVTTFKTRGSSVPCESINLHCSLRRTPTI